MSQENVELARRGYEALNEGGLERITEFLDPDIEWEISSVAPNAGTYRGLHAVRALIEDWLGAFDELRIEPEEFIDVNPEQVVVVVRDRGRIKGSGLRVDHGFAHVWTLRRGKLARFQSFFDKQQALDAAGATGRAASPGSRA